MARKWRNATDMRDLITEHRGILPEKILLKTGSSHILLNSPFLFDLPPSIRLHNQFTKQSYINKDSATFCVRGDSKSVQTFVHQKFKEHYIAFSSYEMRIHSDTDHSSVGSCSWLDVKSPSPSLQNKENVTKWCFILWFSVPTVMQFLKVELG